MSTDFNDLILTLYNDLNRSKTLFSPKAQEKLKLGQDTISGNHSDSSMDLKCKIGVFLEEVFYIIYDKLWYDDSSCQTELKAMNEAMKNSEGRYLRESIIICLRDEQFHKSFLSLFTKKLNSETIFPCLLKDPNLMTQLEKMLQYCVEQDLEVNTNLNPPSKAEKQTPETPTEEETSCCPPVNMIILGAFIAVLGIAAVAAALFLLYFLPAVALTAVAVTAITVTIAVGAGVFVGGLATSGVGFFRQSHQDSMRYVNDDELELKSFSSL